LGAIAYPTAPPTLGLPDANYYVLESNSVYFAINGSNQQNFLTGGNAPSVINTVFQKMVSGQKIVIRGNIQVNATLTPPLGVYVDLGNATIRTIAPCLKAFEMYSKSGVTIDGGYFYGRDDNSGLEYAIRSYLSDRTTIINGIFEGVGGSPTGGGIVVECQGGVGFRVQNNTFLYNRDSYAIVFNDKADDSIITGNNIDSGGRGSGIGVFGQITGLKGNVTISYNTITGWGQNPDYGQNVHWHAIYITDMPHSKVCGNVMGNPNMPSCGVSILIKSLYTEIYNNTVNAAPTWGIHIYQEVGLAEDSPSGSKIYNNLFNGSNVGGIYLVPNIDNLPIENIEISSNTFCNLNNALWVEGLAHSPIINTTIKNNDIHNVRYGIRVGSSGTSFVNGISITNNSFTSISPNPAVYIETGTTAAVISYNTFTNNARNVMNYTSSISIYGNIGEPDYNPP
jgi:hypothetical protein